MGEIFPYLIAGLGSIIGAFGGVIMWFASTRLKNIEIDVRTNTTDINNIRVHYLHKEEFKDFKTELKENFQNIQRRLDEIVTHVQSR